MHPGDRCGERRTLQAWPRRMAPLALAAALCACSSGPLRRTPPPEPTLRSLEGREVDVRPDTAIVADEDKAIAAYRDFLRVAPPDAPQRSEALRRLGDLEMDGIDNRAAEAAAVDYRSAVARYEDYLKAYPRDPGNDRVLYQLARAHELGGALEESLKALDQLVQAFPKTPYFEEAQFRRGELLFAMSQYGRAEQAYAQVLQGDQLNPYRDRSLYMQGWSLFKLGRLDDALHPFLGVLDLKLAGSDPAVAELEALPGLSRADRELVEDTFRVIGLCLASLQGADSIAPYVNSDVRRNYEFRIYQQLAELYLKQDRVKDAADTLGAFARHDPLHQQAPQLQARVIDIYARNGFETLALGAKREYVERYGIRSEFRRANPAGWERAQPLVKTHLAELARHHHARAQKDKSRADAQEAVRWYREFIASFPQDPQAVQGNFLLAELLFEDARYSDAAAEYEKTAYEYPAHPRSADAGYAALLSYAALEKRAAAGSSELTTLQRTGVESSLRFAKAFPADARSAAVLTRAAEQLYALQDTQAAADVANQVLARDPPPPPAQRRVAWLVAAHTSFELGQFDRAERAYGEVLALTPAQDAGRAALSERVAASIYKQGEQARNAGLLRDAVTHFERIAVAAPQSPVRATAQYDAAAALVTLKDWAGAARTLEDFRQRYPRHALQDDVIAKLAAVYLEQGQWTRAAGELERVAATRKDPVLVRDALWQVAELYDKASGATADEGEGAARAPARERAEGRALAAKAYERYLRQYPQPLETAIEVRWRLARIAQKDGNRARELAWMKEVFQADQAGGGARTERTRYRGALAALALAEPVLERYRQVALVEPLQKQLKLKKARMQDVLKAYGVAADYGVADVTTAATYHIGALYQDFGKAMLNSQRPRRLSKAELEQYNIMLEEQAYPFEEKATELHELNVRRAADGIYDQWVRNSFKALGELRPVRYGKSERSEAVIDAIH